MPLKDKTWLQTGFSSMELAFLRAERHKIAALLENSQELGAALALIDRPDPGCAEENLKRHDLLYRIRGGLLDEIPADTAWFEVHKLTNAELIELHIIARCGWDDPENRDRNELFPAAKRAAKILETPPSKWPMPILWGHDRNGPFTILEGNNRLAGYAALSDPPPLDIPVLIGLSPQNFHRHIFDPE